MKGSLQRLLCSQNHEECFEPAYSSRIVCSRADTYSNDMQSRKLLCMYSTEAEMVCWCIIKGEPIVCCCDIYHMIYHSTAINVNMSFNIFPSKGG